MIKQKDLLWCLFFIVFWIIPIGYVGLTNRDLSGIPRVITYIQRISFLFPYSIESWPIFYIQALPDGSQTWMTLDEEKFFRLRPFGYRTRLHQLLYASKDLTGYPTGRERADDRREELARWIARRYTQLFPGLPRLRAVRFVAGFYRVQRRSSYEGHWRNPFLESFPENLKYIVSTHYF
jgi:hypothetical protein